MAASRVIRFLQTDKTKTPVLVNATRKEDGHDLDLDLLATDGDAAYAGKREGMSRAHTTIFANNLVQYGNGTSRSYERRIMMAPMMSGQQSCPTFSVLKHGLQWMLCGTRDSK